MNVYQSNFNPFMLCYKNVGHPLPDSIIHYLRPDILLSFSFVMELYIVCWRSHRLTQIQPESEHKNASINMINGIISR